MVQQQKEQTMTRQELLEFIDKMLDKAAEESSNGRHAKAHGMQEVISELDKLIAE